MAGLPPEELAEVVRYAMDRTHICVWCGDNVTAADRRTVLANTSAGTVELTFCPGCHEKVDAVDQSGTNRPRTEF